MVNKILKKLLKEASNTTDGDVLLGQHNLIEKAFSIIRKQLADIDFIPRELNNETDVGRFRKDILLVTKKRYLDFFYQVSRFLLKKIKSEERDNLRFYLPNVRTLLDIYARLLYLANHDLEKQSMICVGELLLNCKNFNIKDSFDELYFHCKSFVDFCAWEIPSYEEFSKQKAKAAGCLFPVTEQMIKNCYFDKFKPVGFDNSLEQGEKLYEIYRYLSGYIHGNIINKDSYGNEDLWIIRNTLVLAVFIVSVIDKDVFFSANSLEINDLINDLKRKEPFYHKYYDEKRKHK
jgi:hypothetical protein